MMKVWLVLACATVCACEELVGWGCMGDDLEDVNARCGADISTKSCAEWCEKTVGCAAWVYSTETKCCELKAACNTRQADDIYVSGTVDIQDLWDADCPGEDIFVNGVYQKKCDITLDHCLQRCDTTAGCGAVVHNYEESPSGAKGKWTDGCCWLKKSCTSPKKMDGKHAVVFRQKVEKLSLWDADCPGEDVFINGVYQKKCDITFDHCLDRCGRTPGCSAVVYNYDENYSGDKGKWTDGCCWLKKSCKSPKPMVGKHAVLFQLKQHPEQGQKAEDAQPVKLPKNEYGSVQLTQLIFDPPLESDIKSTTAPQGESPQGEGPEKLFDNKHDTKWVDFRHAPVIIELNRAVDVQSYKLVMGNDSPERDPMAWRLSGSENGVVWEEMSEVTEDVGIARLSESKAYETKGSWKWLKFEVLSIRAQPGKVKAVSVEATVIDGIACEGGDLVVNGYYQRACGIEESMCRMVCSRTLSCSLYTYELETKCCALKTSCSDHREQYGRHVYIVRHTHYPQQYPGGRSPVETMKDAMEGHDLNDVKEVLDLLSKDHDHDEVMKAVLEWAEREEEDLLNASEETEKETDFVLPWFALPRKQAPRDLNVMLQELEMPRRN
eukprot:TRINITY_DN459_c0_g1_i1.p1 TRINITY_DN459_c0_g1~~TRINITY_DN459_c0_g1_i1.p1  ORF type:complete len:608 (+),score=156.61 TRINITY_DN459_c0_g1_i1:66-1889(+)